MQPNHEPDFVLCGGTTSATGCPNRVTRTGAPVRRTSSSTARHVALNLEIAISRIPDLYHSLRPWSEVITRTASRCSNLMSAMLTRRQLMLASTLAVTNCGRGHRKMLAVIPKANADLFFLTVHAGAQEAARTMNVGITWSGPDQETDYGRQIQIVDVMIARRVDGLAISATDDRALIGPLLRVSQAGIPITVFDSAVAIENYVSLVATDNYGAGCNAARLLAGLLPGTQSVAMLMQKPGGTSTVLREARLRGNPGNKEFPRLKIVARQFGMGDRARLAWRRSSKIS